MMPIFKGEYDNLNPPNPNSKSLSKTKNHSKRNSKLPSKKLIP